MNRKTIKSNMITLPGCIFLVPCLRQFCIFERPGIWEDCFGFRALSSLRQQIIVFCHARGLLQLNWPTGVTPAVYIVPIGNRTAWISRRIQLKSHIAIATGLFRWETLRVLLLSLADILDIALAFAETVRPPNTKELLFINSRLSMIIIQSFRYQ